MTNKEARKILLTDADFTGSGEKAKLTADALCLAVEALEKLDRYRWHDLRKIPADLPDGKGGKCKQGILCIMNIKFKDGYNANVSFVTSFEEITVKETDTRWIYERKKKNLENVIAWRYIEPFEEVEG